MKATSVLSKVSGPGSRLSAAAAGSVVSSLGGAAGRFVIQVVLAQLLGTTAYGIFVTLRGWGELLATLPNRGHQGTVVRFLPQYRDRGDGGRYAGLFRFAVRVTAFGGAGLGIVAFGGSLALSDHPHLALAFAMAGVPAWALLRLLQSVLQAQHKFVLANLIVQIVQPAILAVTVGLIWLVGQVDLTATLAALLLSVALSAIIAGSVARSTAVAAVGRPAPADDALVWRAAANHFYLGQLAIAVIGMADILVLAMFVSPTTVALYSIASRLAILGRVVNSGLEAIVAPRISEAWNRDDRAGLQRLTTTTIALSTVPTIAIAAFLALFRGPVLGIVGEEYRAAGTVMVILLIGNVVNALTGPSGYVVSLTGNEKIHARIMSLTAIGLVVGCLAVAGPWGAVGVAVVRTVANAAWNLALVVFARRQLGVRCYPTLTGIGR